MISLKVEVEVKVRERFEIGGRWWNQACQKRHRNFKFEIEREEE